MVSKKINGGKRASAEDWLNNKWVKFHLKYQKHIKLWNKDRSDFSKMAAKAKLLLDHLNELKFNPKAKYEPTTKFDNSQILQIGFKGVFVRDIKQISRKTIKSNNPYAPDKALIDACYCNIDPTSTGLLLNKAPLKTGVIPTVVYKPPISLVDANHTQPEEYIKPISGYNIVSGGWTGNREHFERFTRGKRFVNTVYKRRITNIKSLESRYNIKNALFRPKKADIFAVPFNGEAKPGGDMTNSFTNKASGWFTCTKAASILWDEIHRRPTPCVSIYTTGGKEKVNSYKDTGERIASRLIMQQDQVEFSLAKPYVKNIENFLFNEHNGPIVIGKSLTGIRYLQLLSKLTYNKFGVEFDWAKFDSTVSPEYAIAAFAWCRSLFEESDEIDNAFLYFCHGFLEKYVVTPDGKTFKLLRGMPSGTAWTTIINSVVNALLMEEIGSRYSPFIGKSFDYMVAGDDGNLLFDEVISFSPKRLVSWVKSKTDMDIEIIRIGEPISDNPDNSLSFNKRVLYRCGNEIKMTTQPALLSKRLFPTGKGSYSYKKLSDTLNGQFAEVINHPNARAVLASAMLSIKSTPFTIEESVSRIIMANEKLYENYVPEKLMGRDVYSSGKLQPFNDKWLFDTDIDVDYVENWLKDNTIRYKRTQISPNSRLKWFISKMGVPSSVPALFNAMLRNSLPKDFNNIFRDDISFILKIWKKWYNVSPYGYVFNVP